ncbi:hypothetical protein [Corallincola holothuriorum]|uniref:hypothetical protein n=1 Tax=Corallincola holothuriorum TaxID=2282215 RepID=UPI0018F17E5F|nr:hypothetical protein [Corallincola holothuriorum]
MKESFAGDLGFEFVTFKNETLEIYHRRKFATRFTGAKAVKLQSQLETISFAEQQQLMARLTGNYKRGSERVAKTHGRNCR